MTENQTWDEGELTADDLIVSADGTGYETPSEFVAGENGIEPDDPGAYPSDDDHAYDSYDDSSVDDMPDDTPDTVDDAY